MRSFICLLVTLCIIASTLCAAAQSGQQTSTPEKQHVGKQSTQNPEAYALYLKGRSYYDKRTRADLETAISYFNQAIAKDPSYAMAYAGLAYSIGRLPDFGASASENIPKSNAAALKAIELDPTLARPHVTLGANKMAHEWDFAGGLAEFKKAVELDPNSADGHEVYAENLGLLGGREQEAIAEATRAHELDPMSPAISSVLGNVYIDARRFDDAIAVCKKLADDNPTFAEAHSCLGTAYWGKQMYAQVIEEWKAYDQLSGDRDDSEIMSAMERGLRSAGWKGALTQGIEATKAHRKASPESSYGHAYYVGYMYAQLGDKDQAFQWLNTALQEHDEGLMALKTDFLLDPIRSDPRFAELVRKVGLPQGTQNPEAYELYLKGRSCFDKQTLSDLKAAASYFNQAIAKDPKYALAYAALARTYAVLPDYGDSPVEDIPKSIALARKAIELDPTLASPHISLGGTLMAHEWDFAGGEAEFKKGLELDPNDAHAHEIYADNLSTLGGREQEALAEVNRAHQLDLQSLSISVEVGTVYIAARRFDEALVACKKVADENPTFAPAHACLTDAYWGKKMYPQVIEEYRAYAQITGDRTDSDYASALEQGFHSEGWKGALSKSIEIMQAQRKTGYSSAYLIAQAYADLGEKDEAFHWLNTAYQEHDEHLMWLRTDFVLDPIRSDPRFAELVRKVGLPQGTPPDETLWPTKGWAIASPTSLGVDEQVLLKLDNDMTSGKYSQMIDSFAVFRCGKKVFERTYPHDYAKIYAKEARERGAYNMRLNGPYNYFDSYWHPYYHGTDLHTMQSISKTVTSVILGAAIERGDFKASLDTPVLKYFDLTKVKNVDDRKRQMTLRHLLTMSSGLEWNATDFENTGNPQNDTSQMEGSDDWVQYTIDKRMAAEPGKVWNYNDGAPVLLAYIFRKETGWDIDDYGQKFVFATLGIRHEWKRSYLGVVDAEGGLYLTGSDLAKIGYLYLNDGMWDGQRVVSSAWVKESVTPYLQTDEPQVKYGFSGQWFMSKLPGRTGDVWLTDGFGYQELMVFPEDDLIVTVTGWKVLRNSAGKEPSPPDFLPLVKIKTCPGMPADAAAK